MRLPSEGTVWLKDKGTTYVSEGGSFGFSVTVKTRVHGDHLWEMWRPLYGIEIVRRLDELVEQRRALLIAHNCGYPLVYACRAGDVPSAGLEGDAWVRVEAWDAS